MVDLSLKEFLGIECKAITFMGMSGVGKTYLSDKLSSWGWVHHSCDFLIGADYLRDELSREMDILDMSPLSEFVGKVGNPALGGLSLDEFKRRQKMYYDAECATLRDAVREMDEQKGSGLVNDSTGSICEIEDEALLALVFDKSLLVYIEASDNEEQRVLQRAKDYPKPLFFPDAFFDERLAVFMAEQEVASVEQVVPDDFARWVFPFLFAARLPKYKRLADTYGVTISSSAFRDIDSEETFIRILSDALKEQGRHDV